MIAWKCNSRGAVNRLRKLAEQMQRPEALLKAVGREGVNQLQRHFREKDTRPNKLSSRREHFWLKVGRSVTTDPVVNVAERTATISITDPRFSQKVFGGIIRAKRVKYLTIPLVAAAYGRSPHTFEQETGAKLFPLGGVLAVQTAGGDIIPIYALKRSVNQKPDPTALPDPTVFKAALLTRAQAVVRRQLNGATTA